jgi:hypothetical protein
MSLSDAKLKSFADRMAAALLEARPAEGAHFQCIEQHSIDCHYLSEALTRVTPDFEQDRFLAACGVSTTP